MAQKKVTYPPAKHTGSPAFEHERGNGGETHQQVGANADDGDGEAHLTPITAFVSPTTRTA